MQKNRNEQNTGKNDLEARKLRNPETRHSLQRRGRGVKATPRTAMWVAQRLAESPQEQRKGILGLWVHPKRQAEVTDETIEEINALSDEDAMEALKELRRPIQYIRKQGGQQMNFEARLQTLEDGQIFLIKALLDSGCTGSCISRDYVRDNQIPTKRTPRPIPIYNADGTLNKDRSITEYVEMRMIVQDHIERIRLAVSNIGRNEVFIGHEWLRKHNPSVDWRNSTIIFDRCPRECGSISSLEDLEGDEDLNMPGIEKQQETSISLENGERLFAFDVNEYMARRIATCVEEQTQEDKVLEEQVPQRYHEYKDVFSEKEFDQLPPRRIWDHAIELTPGFKPVDCKIYPMNQEQNRLLEEFIEENIRTGRI
jgi:hypothetical protein